MTCHRLLICVVLGLIGGPVPFAPAWACEPASIDWASFMQSYDKNRNQTLDMSEFDGVREFSPYAWPADYAGADGHRRLFKALDQNRDGELSSDEQVGVYAYLPNPCAGWPWR